METKTICGCVPGLLLALLGGLSGSTALAESSVIERTYLVGQDFGSVRDYYVSDCCVKPDGATTYLGLYDLLSAPQFGGLGMDGQGRPTPNDADWGAGATNAYKNATGLPITSLAIGLSIAEDGHPGALKQLVAGKYDAEIDQLALFLRKANQIVYLRIGYEFDGAWNAGYGDPAQYVAAWRYIVDRLTAKGVKNTLYVWQFSSAPLDDLIDGRQEDIGPWYPGDDYVDLAGISWFLTPDYQPPAKDGFTAQTQGQLRDEFVAFANAHHKPVMIAELSPQGYDLKARTKANISPLLDGRSGRDRVKFSDDDIWTRWYAPLFDYLAAHPEVRVLAYINADWEHQKMWGPPYSSGYWGNSRLQDNPAIATRWNAAVRAWKSQP